MNMKKYKKIINGNVVIKQLKHIVVHNNGMATYNPTEELAKNDGWVEYIEETEESNDLLNETKMRVLDELAKFDESSEVNDCIIKVENNELHYWADKHERDSLKNAVNYCISAGRETYRLDLRELGLSLDIKCSVLASILSELELYAIDCYNKTTDHIYAINKLSSIDDINKYDYRKGYPKKLKFNL